MRFPPSFIERLRSHFLLSDLIGKRIPVKKHGREYQGLCPFHNEKSPSFTINNEKGFYHCFGCAAHGDAIEFVRRYDRLSYPEAIEQLAREAGIPLPQMTREEARRSETEKTLYDVLEAAAAWFEKQLLSTAGTVARDYLENRGLKPETLRAFRAGYAPDERTALYNHLLAAGFSQPLQAEAGLIVLPEQGAPYDRFRGRVMLPIRNASGKIIAFGGRILGSTAGKNIPKYLNSPETPVFHKSDVLYNLDLAKKSARDSAMAVVMEGYMDVVSAAQSGIGYAVATLGTAVTPEHLRLLWQLVKEPVLCLDGDAAGQRAMMRAAEVALPLLKPGYSLRFALLPKGEDPDSYVRKYGAKGFENILAASRRLSQTLWENTSAQFKIDLPEGRAALEDALLQLAGKIAHPSVRHHYLSYFRQQLWSKSSGKGKPAPTRSTQIERIMAETPLSLRDTLVRQMLCTLYHFPPLLHKGQVEELLPRLLDDATDPRLKTLCQALLSAIQNDIDPDDAAAFAAFIQAQLAGETLAAITGNIPHLSPGQLTAEDATALWAETAHAYAEEVEAEKLEESNRLAWDEANHSRLQELQQKRFRRMAALAESGEA